MKGPRAIFIGMPERWKIHGWTARFVPSGLTSVIRTIVAAREGRSVSAILLPTVKESSAS